MTTDTIVRYKIKMSEISYQSSSISKYGTITYNNKEYKLNAVTSRYSILCINGAIVGGMFGAICGTILAGSSPFIIGYYGAKYVLHYIKN